MIGYTDRFYMPLQKVSSSQKLNADGSPTPWARQSVDAIIGMSSSTFANGRTSRQNKQINYDLYNSKHDDDDFDYIINPYGQSRKAGEQPSKIQNYNIIKTNIEVLKGEEIKRPFNFFARSIAGGSESAREQVKRNMILQHLKTRLMQELGQEVDPEEASQMSLPDIEKYMKTQYIDPRETTANQLIKYLLKREKLEMKFNEGWEHALIAAEEIYYVGIVSGEPKVRVVNPLNFEFDKDADLKFIEDAQWCKEERWMSKSSVLDTYGEFLTDPELDLIDSDQFNDGSSDYGMQAVGFARELSSFKHNLHGNQHGILVTNVCWKSWKKIGFLTWFDEEGGQPIEEMVDETFKLSSDLKALGATIGWRWINEVWEGTRIGGNIYVNIRPLPNQTRSMDNPSECKLPYTGYIYNNTNSQSTSLVDLIKPHQYTYTIVWWRLEQELAKAKGKAFVMDMAQLPKSQGMSVDEWIAYFDNVGVAFINSMEEGTEGAMTGQISKFNQFQSIDRSLSAVVSQYMEVLNKLEQLVDNLTGVNQQRKAQTSPSETATGVQTAIVQSSHITEPYFYYHNLVKAQVLTKLLECSKVAYADGKKIKNVVDEVYQEIIDVDGETFADSDYGVFVTNSSKDFQTKEKMLELASIAMQNDKLTMTDYMTILDEDSISAIRSKIAETEEEAKNTLAEQQQADRDNQKAMNDAQIKDAQDARANDNLNKQLDRENKIQVAALSASKSTGSGNISDSGLGDSTEQAKVQIELSKQEFEKSKEMNKQGTEIAKANMQMKLAQDKNALDMSKQQLEAAKFEREQGQQDALNKVKVATDIKKSQLEEQKLAAEIRFKQQELADKKEERKFKMKELDVKMALEKFKANEKIKADRLKTQADIAAKKMKTKADIAAKKKQASIKTKPKNK